MAKIETAIRDAIARGARKQVRGVAVPLRREVRRLREAVRALRAGLAAVQAAAAQWRRLAGARAWQAEVSERESEAARLSPRLIRKLRTRLGLSQVQVARLVGVSATAVVQWERGRSAPAGPNRRTLVGLRRLGRRDARQLLAGMEAAASPARKAPGRARRNKRRQRPKGKGKSRSR